MKIRGSVLVCADHLAAIARGERLVDPNLGPGCEEVGRSVRIARHPHGISVARRYDKVAHVVPGGLKSPSGLDPPALNRILDKPDRAVGEREIRAAGMEARGRRDIRVGSAIEAAEIDNLV